MEHEEELERARRRLLGLLARRPKRLRASTSGLEHLVAWTSLALVNAAYISARLTSPGPTRRALHHLYDAGHFLFVGGTLSLATLTLGRAIGASRRRARVAVFAAALVPVMLFVRDDIVGFFLSRLDPTFADVALWASLLATALLPLTAWEIGRLLARSWLRLLPIGLGLAAQVGNQLVLTADYRGLHLFATLLAGVLVAAGCSGVARSWSGDGPKRPWRGVVLSAAVSAAAAVSVVLPPSNAVRVELSRVEGTPLFVPLARWGWGFSHGDARVPPELRAWFEPRDHLPQVPPSRPALYGDDLIVLLIGVDSMRADIFEKPNNRRRLPTLFKLRDESVSFSLARSPGSRTITTWSSVFTGKTGTGLRYGGDGNHLNIRPDRSVRFPDLLLRAGVTTSTFSAYSALDRRGLTRGFTEGADVPRRDGQSFGLSTECIPQVIERLERLGTERLFLFTHLMDPHFPYDSVKTTGTTMDRFLSEVEQVDRSMATLLEAIDRLGLRDRTVLVFVADHGEGFGQHGARYHTVNLYEELLRVPIFIRAPGIPPGRIDEPISLVDLGPTILDLFGLPTPGHFLGRSLVPYLRGETGAPPRPIFAEKKGVRALILGSRKVILDREKGREELYDLESDPGEMKNLADSLDDEGRNALALTRLFFETHALPDQR
jgi:hypothetical protein